MSFPFQLIGQIVIQFTSLVKVCPTETPLLPGKRELPTEADGTYKLDTHTAFEHFLDDSLQKLFFFSVCHKSKVYLDCVQRKTDLRRENYYSRLDGNSNRKNLLFVC